MRNGWLRGLFILVLVAGVGALGYAIGASHGPGPGGAASMHYYGHWGGGPWFGGFHFLGFFLFLFVMFAVVRMLLFAAWGTGGGMWGPRHWGAMHDGGSGPEGRAERFDEWHRRSHERIEGTSKGSSTSGSADASGSEPPTGAQ